MAEAVFEMSPRGANRLRYDGYFYILNGVPRQANDYKRWKCAKVNSKWKCQAKTKTKEFDGIIMVQNPIPEHSHPREYEV